MQDGKLIIVNLLVGNLQYFRACMDITLKLGNYRTNVKNSFLQKCPNNAYKCSYGIT